MTSANPPERRSSKNEPPLMASHHDAILMNPGPPALYRLNTERKYINGNDRKLRQWTYGRRDGKKQNKVILMVGETGAGETTIINTMINYLLGVKFEDQEFYQITEETEEEKEQQEQEHEGQSQSQTSEITIYEVVVEEKPTSLTIIDTPGYANTEGYEKDREISDYLCRLFSNEDGIHYIDAVCFVMKAAQNRFSAKEHYIFHSVLSLFGRDIENNIVFLLTHSDGGRPTDALNAINTVEIPFRRDKDNEPVHFLFNNRQKEERDEQYEHLDRSSWEMGERSMNEFFTLLEEMNRKSIQMTLDVLNEQRRLGACVSNLKQRISEKELKNEHLNKIQEAIRQNKDKIEKCENSEFTVKRRFKEKVLIENTSRWSTDATCCSVCEENCHEWGCWLEKDASCCSVMENKHCTMCTGKCHYSKHVKENKKYVIKTKEVKMTFHDLKQEYERTGEKTETTFDKEKYENTKKKHESNMQEYENKTKIEKKLISELEKIENEKSKLLAEAYISIMILSKIALKADSAFTLQHLDFLIPRLKEEGKDEWIKNLDDLRKAGEEQRNKGAFCHVMDFGRQKWKQIVSRGKNE
ncbi:uncharacterized protein LOC127501611 [Ctenopharyngodon idella]|uniref:uncharacterized protein LOC127501611 n=1 Tax=Ctenopharyngodon idella TaxID=7959 RepID=UPI00222EB35E|nr:uncharacterized protein LOC127501611 [Ctenopharyngodon idella]